MEDYESLSHTKRQCKHHITLTPRHLLRNLLGTARRELGNIFHRLAEQKGCRIEEGHVMSDHVQMQINVPPKVAVSSVVGYPKGKSAIHVARHFMKKERNYAGQSLWAMGDFVNTTGSGVKRRKTGRGKPTLHTTISLCCNFPGNEFLEELQMTNSIQPYPARQAPHSFPDNPAAALAAFHLTGWPQRSTQSPL